MRGVTIFDDDPQTLAPAQHPAQAFDFGAHGLVVETPTQGDLVRDGQLRLRGLVEGGRDPVVSLRVRLNGGDLGRVGAGSSRRDVDLAGFDAVFDVSGLGCRLDLRITGVRASGATAEVKLLTLWRAAYRPATFRLTPLVVEYRADRGDPSRISGRVAGPDLPVAVDVWRAGGVTTLSVGRDGAFAGPLKGGGSDAVHLWARFAHRRPDAYLGVALVSKRGHTPLAATLDASDGAPAVRFRDASGVDPHGAGDWRAEAAAVFINGRSATLSPLDGGGPDAYRLAPAGWADALPDQLVFEGRSADGRWTYAEGWNLTGAPLRSFMAASAAGKALRVTQSGRSSVIRALRLNPTGEDLAFIATDAAGALQAVPLASIEQVAIAHDADFDVDPTAEPAFETSAFIKSLPGPGYRLRSAEGANGSVALACRAVKEPPASVDRVVLVCPGRHATDEIYVRRPLESLLAALGVALEVVDLSQGGPAAEAKLDRPLKAGTVVIVSRQANDAWIERLTRAQRGAFIIYLMDDDPPAAADTPGLPPRYRQRMIEQAGADFQALLRLCDRFVVAGPAMAERYASSKTVLMEPPFVREPEGLAHFDDLGEIRVAYHGTDVHKDDIGFLYEPLGRVLRRFPKARLQVISAVKPPASFRGVGNFERIAPMSWPDYKAFARENCAHLNLAPLLDTPFNRGKSIIKVLDSASLGAAGLYSKIDPYDRVVTDGRDGVLVENDPALWEHTLGTLLGDPKILRPIAEAGAATARRVGDIRRCTALWRDLLGL